MKQEEKSLHIFCMKCKKVITSKTAKCGIKGKASKCSHKGQHRLQSRIWNKDKKRVTNVRTWPKEMPFEKVVTLHREYKTQCQAEEVKPVVKVVKPTKLEPCILMFLDFLQDINVPEHSKKNLSKHRISTYHRYLKRFYDLVGNVSIYSISDIEVGQFHKWILERFGPRSYNDHMIALNVFFKFLIKSDYPVKNSFNFTRKPSPKKVEILTGEDLEKLFGVLNFENGKAIDTKGDKINFYRPWLKDAILLGLLTGERADGIFYLQWKHVEANYLKIPNFKLLRQFEIEEYHYAPITLDLAELLLKLGYGNPDEYLIAPERRNRESLKVQNSGCFTFFWKLTGIDKDISFRNLRKTYITRIRMILGDKAKALNIHKSDEVQINHYINQKIIQEELLNVRLF